MVNLESSNFEKESSSEQKLQQNIVTGNEYNNQSSQPEVDLSVNYVLVDIDKESNKLEASDKFVESPIIKDTGENLEDLPFKNYLEFRQEIVEEVMEKCNQDGLDTLATIAGESSKKENMVTIIIISEGECSTP